MSSDSIDPLLQAIDDIQTENHQRLKRLTQKLEFFKDYLQGNSLFQKVKLSSDDEIIISVEGIFTDIVDLFLIRRDKSFLKSCIKIIQDKFKILSSNDPIQSIKAKRIHEIKYSFDKALGILEERLAWIKKEVSEKTDFWDEIDPSEKALLYLPQYKYIQNLLREIDVTTLDRNLLIKQLQNFSKLKEEHRDIVQSVEEFNITWTD